MAGLRRRLASLNPYRAGFVGRSARIRVKGRIRKPIGFAIVHRNEDLPWLDRRSDKSRRLDFGAARHDCNNRGYLGFEASGRLLD